METINYVPNSNWLLYNIVSGNEIPLQIGLTKIGNDYQIHSPFIDPNKITIPSSSVSLTHATINISPNDKHVTIKNCRFSTSTFINGKKMRTSKAQEIGFGDQVSFWIHEENFDLDCSPVYIIRRPTKIYY